MNLLWCEKSTQAIIIRWRVHLQSYDFRMMHLKGVDMGFADWQSRMHNMELCEGTTIPEYPDAVTMFNSVHGGRNLHHGAKRTHFLLCARYPGHNVPMRVIQTLVSECPMCQKDRLGGAPIPSAEVTETLMHHKRCIGMDHVTVTPHSENGSVGALNLVEHDTKFCQVYPVKTYSAEEVASKLFKHYCTFGGYDAVYSDPGSAFTSDIVKHLNSWLGMEHRISLVGRH